jgi:PelA/Pel-15E family pectate lyase
MKTSLRNLLLILLITAIHLGLLAQRPIEQLSWKQVATQMPDYWYGSDESKRVAENILLYQRSIGGWPKNIEMHKPLTKKQKSTLLSQKVTLDAIFDNDATTTEMKFLARMYNKTGTEEYKTSFIKGLNYILEAQYDNGGWPMFYPLKKGYYTHITYNDNAIVNILEMLRDIFNKRPLYSFVAAEDVVLKSQQAYNKGIDCILKTQIVVNGKPTVWCAQHDENTLLPAEARSYELPSFSGAESVGIIKLLMDIPDPSLQIIKAVQGAVEWLDLHRLNNVKWEYFINSDGLKDRKIVYDKEAGVLWARFYDLET